MREVLARVVVHDDDSEIGRGRGRDLLSAHPRGGVRETRKMPAANATPPHRSAGRARRGLGRGMPALPEARYASWPNLSAVHANACSRPPPATLQTFTSTECHPPRPGPTPSRESMVGKLRRAEPVPGDRRLEPALKSAQLCSQECPRTRCSPERASTVGPARLDKPSYSVLALTCFESRT